MLHMDGHTRGACECCHVRKCLFLRLFGCLLPYRCLWNLEHNFSLFNIFWGLLNLYSWSSQSLHKSSDVLLCQFAWFLGELNQNTLKLLSFGKNTFTWLKYKKHYKCPVIISNCSKIPQFWMKNLLKITE